MAQTVTNELEENLSGLNVVWRGCRKYQSAITRYNIKLREEFCQHDPDGIGLISKSIFTAILSSYKNAVGISSYEINELTDYFQLRDGRVSYQQFCKLVCSENDQLSGIQDFSSGVELNDPMHVNILHQPEERRRLFILLVKIAQTSHLPLQPYFQDYLLISKSSGLVTIPHFRRVLSFMKINLSHDEYLLLTKRYMKDSYLFNYAGFIQHIQNITQYLKEEGLLNNSRAIIDNFPGKLADLDLPEFPTFDGDKMMPQIFPDSTRAPRTLKQCEVVIYLQKRIFERRIRVREFLEGFDLLNTGNVTVNQFERSLHSMGIGNYLTQREFKLLCERFVDPIDTNRIRWREFADEMDQVFTVKNLEKEPELEVESPPKYIEELRPPGEMNWSDASPEVRDHCEEALKRIQALIKNRRIHMHPFFRNYDKLRSGHLNFNQFNQVLVSNGILLSKDELNALRDRYGNELGIDYGSFLYDADPALYAVPQIEYKHRLTCANKSGAELDFEGDKNPLNKDYVIYVLSKAKRIITTLNIPLIDFLIDYDRHREGEILEVDFRRGLDNANVKLTPEEVDVICINFRSRKRACAIAYRNLIKALQEIFVVVQSPNSEYDAVPIKHFANLDCLECTLNFDERTLCSHALMKFARKADNISNLSQVLKDFDRENTGVITRNQFLRGITLRQMHYLVSGREFEAVCKNFGVQRGNTWDFNYRNFMNILNILHENGQIQRNY